MSQFEEWFVAQDFYTNMRFIHGDALFLRDGDVYRVLPVQMTYTAYKHQQTEKARLEKRVEKITHLATELAEYASYAEIVGAVTHNRSAVRKYCDEIFDFNREVDSELEQALRGEP